MKKFLTLIAAAFLVASVASAAPCATGTSVLSLGTCEFGGLTFSNWDVAVSGFTSATVFLGTGSAVVGNSVNVEFQLSTNPLSAPVNGGDIILRYVVSGELLGVDLTLGSVFGGVGIIENVCGDNPSDGCQTTLAQLSVINGVNTTDAATFASPVNQAWITKDIQFLEGGRVSDFVNSHETAIPEPMTCLLMGSGLLALGLLRRKISRS